MNNTTAASPATPDPELGKANTLIRFPVSPLTQSRLGGRLRYWWCWFVAALMLVIVGIPGLLFTSLIGRRTWMYPLALWGARTWLSACGARVTVKGLENLDTHTNYVFASNHRSYLDTATLFAFTGRRMGIVAKKELLKVPVLGQGMSFVNVIAIDRTNPERALASMNKARDVMADGYSFGVFVEGTRAMPGELLPFKKGAFHLALQMNAPVVPVAVRNTDVMMGKRQGVAYSGEIEMVILPAIPTSGKTPDDVMDLLLTTRSAIARELGNQTS